MTGPGRASGELRTFEDPAGAEPEAGDEGDNAAGDRTRSVRGIGSGSSVAGAQEAPDIWSIRRCISSGSMSSTWVATVH